MADARETPAKPIIKILIENGAEVYAHDPFVNPATIISMGAKPVEIKEILNRDCVILLTDHDQYRQITPEMIKSQILICNRPILDPKPFKNKGIIFKGVGRP